MPTFNRTHRFGFTANKGVAAKYRPISIPAGVKTVAEVLAYLGKIEHPCAVLISEWAGDETCNAWGVPEFLEKYNGEDFLEAGGPY